MNELGLGKINPPAHERDAVHVAIIQAVCSERLRAGDTVVLTGETEPFSAQAADGHRGVGVVDPFIDTSVKAGQRVWIYLNPGSITTLRHVWTHPNIGKPAPKNEVLEAQEALKKFATEELGITYETLLDAADTFVTTGEWLTMHRFEGVSQPKDFWKWYYAVTGNSLALDQDEDDRFFSCGGCS